MTRIVNLVSATSERARVMRKPQPVDTRNGRLWCDGSARSTAEVAAYLLVDSVSRNAFLCDYAKAAQDRPVMIMRTLIDLCESFAFCISLAGCCDRRKALKPFEDLIVEGGYDLHSLFAAYSYGLKQVRLIANDVRPIPFTESLDLQSHPMRTLG